MRISQHERNIEEREKSINSSDLMYLSEILLETWDIQDLCFKNIAFLSPSYKESLKVSHCRQNELLRFFFYIHFMPLYNNNSLIEIKEQMLP